MTLSLYATITKIDREQRLVFGYASTEALDQQGEIVKRDAIERALPDYMRFANIREMHQPSAVGVAKEAEIDEKGLRLGAKVIDDSAWEKVKEGVYKGFSIGGRVTARDPQDRHVITGIDLTEISLVDRPANPEAVFEMFKSADGDDPVLVLAEQALTIAKAINDIGQAIARSRDCLGILVQPAQVVKLAKGRRSIGNLVSTYRNINELMPRVVTDLRGVGVAVRDAANLAHLPPRGEIRGN